MQKIKIIDFSYTIRKLLFLNYFFKLSNKILFLIYVKIKKIQSEIRLRNIYKSLFAIDF